MYLKKIFIHLLKKEKQKVIIPSESLTTALRKKQIYQNKLKQFSNDKKIKLKIDILDLIIIYLMEIETDESSKNIYFK